MRYQELECGSMPNVMVALPNIGGALCSTPQSLADAHYYTVNHKKRDIFLTITFDNLNRFLYFLYHFNREEILHATIIKFITSP